MFSAHNIQFVESGFAQAQVLVNMDQLAELQGLGDVHHTVQRTKALKHPLHYPHFLCSTNPRLIC